MKIKVVKKKINKFLLKDPESFGLVNAFYVFLIGIFLLYGGLIWGLGEKIRKEEDFVPKTNMDVALEKNIRSLVTGFPMERMAPYLAQKDPKVATYLVAIGKNESNWGKHTPKKNGKECWNFWGFRGDHNQTRSGYSCFKSPRQAVNVVGTRVAGLIREEKIDTPREMAIAWKCGYDCSWDNPAAVSKWVEDIGYYVKKMEE